MHSLFSLSKVRKLESMGCVPMLYEIAELQSVFKLEFSKRKDANGNAYNFKVVEYQGVD